jgi:hypothetical protein
VDALFKASLKQLEVCFNFFTASGRSHANAAKMPRASLKLKPMKAEPDNSTTMSLQEWLAFVIELDMLNDNEFHCVAPHAFTVGAAVNPQEATSKRHLEIGQPEFLMALAWVIFKRAGCREGQVAGFAEAIKEVFDDNLTQLYKRVLEWSGKDGTVCDIESKFAHWSVGAAWVHKMWSLIQSVFKVADDDNDGSLSPRELRLALASRGIISRLAALGVEVEHVNTFFDIADLDHTGTITPIEALHGFVSVKERLQGDERALRFLRQALAKRDDDVTTFDPTQLVAKAAFQTAAGSDEIQAKMQILGLDFELMDLWGFLETRAGESGLRQVSLEAVLSGYIAFRDPQRHVADSSKKWLTDVLYQADLDGDGSIDIAEFRTLLSNDSVQQAMRKKGFLESGSADTGDGEKDRLVQMLFHRFDSDGAPSLTVKDVVAWFCEVREMSKLRELAERTRKMSVAPPPVEQQAPAEAAGRRQSIFGKTQPARTAEKLEPTKNGPLVKKGKTEDSAPKPSRERGGKRG